LSDNEILKLENFPLLHKLQSILLNNNRVCRIAKGLGEFLPKLTSLILSGNKLTNLSDIDNLTELKKLTHLSLLNNPLAKQDHYRLYVIHKVPSLKVLDFRKIKPQERKEAEKRYGPSIVDGKTDSKTTPSKTFVVGDGVPKSTQSSKRGLTIDQKKKIMEAIKKANSLGEIERLEKILSSGKLPADFDSDGTGKENKSENKIEQDSDIVSSSVQKGQDKKKK